MLEATLNKEWVAYLTSLWLKLKLKLVASPQRIVVPVSLLQVLRSPEQNPDHNEWRVRHCQIGRWSVTTGTRPACSPEHSGYTRREICSVSWTLLLTTYRGRRPEAFNLHASCFVSHESRIYNMLPARYCVVWLTARPKSLIECHVV